MYQKYVPVSSFLLVPGYRSDQAKRSLPSNGWYKYYYVVHSTCAGFCICAVKSVTHLRCTNTCACAASYKYTF